MRNQSSLILIPNNSVFTSAIHYALYGEAIQDTNTQRGCIHLIYTILPGKIFITKCRENRDNTRPNGTLLWYPRLMIKRVLT